MAWGPFGGRSRERMMVPLGNGHSDGDLVGKILFKYEMLVLGCSAGSELIYIMQITTPKEYAYGLGGRSGILNANATIHLPVKSS